MDVAWAWLMRAIAIVGILFVLWLIVSFVLWAWPGIVLVGQAVSAGGGAATHAGRSAWNDPGHAIVVVMIIAAFLSTLPTIKL